MLSLASSEVYTVAWIAALRIERAVGTAMLDERHGEPDGFTQHPADINSYTWGRIGKHNVVISSLPEGIHGTTSAATVVSSLLASLPHIRIGLLVGIGGAVPKLEKGRDIRLGDIAVSRPSGTNGGVVQYDLGKATDNQIWLPTGSLAKPPLPLLSAVGSLRAEHEFASSKVEELLKEMYSKFPTMLNVQDDGSSYAYPGSEVDDRLYKAEYSHYVPGDGCEECDLSFEIIRPIRNTTTPRIHYGTIASGNMVVKDAITRDQIADIAGTECICVEMEAAGIMHHFPCLVIRGMCDYADSHKNDAWQRYAAATAAAYAKELLGFVRVDQVQASARVVDILGPH